MNNNLTNGEMARLYAEKVTKPIQDKTPILIQKVKRGESYTYWFSNTGTIKTLSTDNFRFCGDYNDNDPRLVNYKHNYSPAGNKGYYAVYTNYVEEYDMLELAGIYMKSNTAKEGEIREWEFVPLEQKCSNGYYYINERIFLFKNDKNLYGINGNPLWLQSDGKYYNKAFNYFTRELARIKMAMLSSEEIYKFTGTKSFQANKYSSELKWPYSWNEWYKRNAPRPITKTQKSIDELVDIKLTSIKDLEEKYPLIIDRVMRQNYYGDLYEDIQVIKKDYLHFEILNEEYCVIRYLYRHVTWSRNQTVVENYFTEPYRIFIDNKGKTTIVQNIGGQYKVTSKPVSNILGYGYGAQVHFGNIEEISKWQRLSWIEDIVTNTTDDKLTTIVALLRHPILELIYKAGYHNIFEALLSDNKVAQNLQLMFNAKEKKKGSVTKLLGCNKQELKWLDDHLINSNRYNKERLVISTLKEIFGTDDISSWSKETIETYFPSVKILLNQSGTNWKFELQHETVNGCRYGYNTHELTEEERLRIQKVLRTTKKDDSLLCLLIDILRMYRRLDNKPDVSDIYDITNTQDMLRYHDAIQELLNTQEAERRAYWNAAEKERFEIDNKKFEKLQEERIEKYEYENNEDAYIIKMPQNLAEITTEGQKLRHCVAGYVHRHAVGDTNIIFLRRKDLPTLPFYTIEVQGDHVVQIHGFSNAWLGKVPDAVRFVIKWLKKTGLACENRILLETADGYASSGNLLNAADFGLE